MKKNIALIEPAQLIGQIWGAQGLLPGFPSEKKLLKFVLQILRTLPGVRECGMCIEGVIAPVRNISVDACSACEKLNNTERFCRLAKETDIWVVPLSTADRRYGYVQIVPDQKKLENLKPLLLNFINLIAINLENRWQKRQLEKTNAELREHAKDLDLLVKKRTAGLESKNQLLEQETAYHERMVRELTLQCIRLEDLVKERTSHLEKIHNSLIHTEKLAALGRLTGSIAHEFNNPLYGVRNVLEQTLDNCHLEQEIKDLLTLGIKECNRMADMIRKLREFYKPSSATKPIETDIRQGIDDMILLSRKQLQIDNITLEKYYAPDLPKIKAIENQMKQVVLNLLQNAHDAIPNGGKIIIRAEALDSKVIISVQDTGEGIPEENLSLIFEPFFTTRSIKGTGLGLPVCYEIIKSHEGDIEVKSKVGEGTVFIVSLPIDEGGIK